MTDLVDGMTEGGEAWLFWIESEKYGTPSSALSPMS
jgi:hypothetical protein